MSRNRRRWLYGVSIHALTTCYGAAHRVQGYIHEEGTVQDDLVLAYTALLVLAENVIEEIAMLSPQPFVDPPASRTLASDIVILFPIPPAIVDVFLTSGTSLC